MAPISVAGFFTFMGYAEGKTTSQIKSKLSSVRLLHPPYLERGFRSSV